MQKLLRIAGFVLVFVLLGWFVDYASRPRLLLKGGELPEPHTIAALRATDKVAQLQSCSLPPVAAGADWVDARGPDAGFAMRLPRDWQLVNIDTVSAPPMHDPVATYRAGDGGRVDIKRVANGNVGATFFADSIAPLKPASECEATNDSAGSIWRFHALANRRGGSHDVRYVGLGDAVTPGGRRYKFDVSSWTASGRDSLASIVASAVLRQ